MRGYSYSGNIYTYISIKPNRNINHPKKEHNILKNASVGTLQESTEQPPHQSASTSVRGTRTRYVEEIADYPCTLLEKYVKSPSLNIDHSLPSFFSFLFDRQAE